MKFSRIIPLLPVCCLLLAGCGERTVPPSATTGSVASVENSAPTVSSADSSSVVAEADSQTVSSQSSSGRSSSVHTASRVTGQASQISQPAEKPPVSSSIELPKPEKTAHTPLAQSAYYGYSQLSAVEKRLYDQIDEAVYKLDNIVELPNSSASWEMMQKVFGYYLADHPQCFWLSRSLRYSAQGKDKQIILAYTDGAAIDEYGDGKWIKLADRNKIKAQIEVYQKQLSQLLGKISASASTFEKEKAAHDAVVERITYSKTIPSDPAAQMASHLFSTYGALVDGSAVCEGYSKLFQHLCYELGINCIQATGVGVKETGREAHMWNLVRLDDGWYQVDTTWDDGLNSGEIPYYGYFNLTSAQMFKDHVVEIPNGTLPSYPLPNCTAEKYHYYNNYCINIRGNALPTNAEAILRDTLERGESLLTIVFPDGINSNCKTILYGRQNSIRVLLSKIAPGKKLASSYSTFDKYVFVKIQ